MEIKTTRRSHLSRCEVSKQKITRFLKRREKETPYTFGGNANWCSHYEKSMVAPQTLKVDLPYDPKIPLVILI
jgi:hypothetical protein